MSSGANYKNEKKKIKKVKNVTQRKGSELLDGNSHEEEETNKNDNKRKVSDNNEITKKKKKTKKNPRSPKDFTCPYCNRVIVGWVVCRHHIYLQHGVIATRSELLNGKLPSTTSGSQQNENNSDSEVSDDEIGSEESKIDDVDDDESDEWLINAKSFWKTYLEGIENESERTVTTQKIFDKNTKKKFRPAFMSKKEYVKRVVEAMKDDTAFKFDAKRSEFTLV